MAYEYILFEQADWVVTLTLNRPEKHNALSQGLLAELREVLDSIEADKDVRVVVITDAGRQAFSTGFDLNPRELAAGAPRDEADWNRLIKLNFADANGFRGHSRKPPIEEAIKKFCNQLG